MFTLLLELWISIPEQGKPHFTRAGGNAGFLEKTAWDPPSSAFRGCSDEKPEIQNSQDKPELKRNQCLCADISS
jgi:hypothetical protein